MKKGNPRPHTPVKRNGGHRVQIKIKLSNQILELIKILPQ
jgi:hypothetical protein